MNIRCVIERMWGTDTTGIWFFDDHNLARVEDGRLVYSPYDEGAQVPPTLLLNGRMEAPALLAALEDMPTATIWKARYEELTAQLELAESRVEKIINKALD